MNFRDELVQLTEEKDFPTLTKTNEPLAHVWLVPYDEEGNLDKSKAVFIVSKVNNDNYDIYYGKMFKRTKYINTTIDKWIGGKILTDKQFKALKMFNLKTFILAHLKSKGFKLPKAKFNATSKTSKGHKDWQGTITRARYNPVLTIKGKASEAEEAFSIALKIERELRDLSNSNPKVPSGIRVEVDFK